MSRAVLAEYLYEGLGIQDVRIRKQYVQGALAPRFEHSVQGKKWRSGFCEGLTAALFNAPDLAKADPDAVILFCRDEPNVIDAEARGFPATTIFLSFIVSWKSEWDAAVRGRTCAILPDAARTGRDRLLAGIRAAGGVAFIVPALPGRKDDNLSALFADDPALAPFNLACAVFEAYAAHLAETGYSYRRSIQVSARLDLVIDECAATLRQDPALYSRGGRVVRLSDDTEAQPPRPLVAIVGTPHLRDRLSKLADFQGEKGPIAPPVNVAAATLERDSLGLRVLRAIVEAPTLRPDGSLLQRPGYDSASGVFFAPGATVFPQVPETPTLGESKAAAEQLLDVLSDFPYIDAGDRAAAVAGILTLVARPAILGCVPVIVFRAPTPGSGKSKQVDVASIIATGRPAARSSYPSSDDEIEKVITAWVLDASRIGFFDNVVGTFGSPALSKAVAMPGDWDGRILGSSRTAKMPLRLTWFVTGNNITFRSDMARRVVVCDIDPGTEHPEDRGGWKYPNLEAHVLENRGALVTAALTLLRGFIAAGKPAHGRTALGGFEEWDSLVRGALVWVGVGDCDAGRVRIRADGDPDRLELEAAYVALRNEFGEGARWTSADAFTRAKTSEALREALEGLTDGRLDANGLRYALRGRRDRIAGGLKLERAGESGDAVRWRIVSVAPF
jgi:hypothetical protein